MQVVRFMIITMIASASGGGALSGIAGVLASRDLSMFAGMTGIVLLGALVMIPVWFLIWGLPSFLVFRCAQRMCSTRWGPEAGVRLAGLVTAAAAAAVFIVASHGDPDTQGLSMIIGLVAVVIAPAIAARTHRAA